MTLKVGWSNFKGSVKDLRIFLYIYQMMGFPVDLEEKIVYKDQTKKLEDDKKWLEYSLMKILILD